MRSHSSSHSRRSMSSHRSSMSSHRSSMSSRRSSMHSHSLGRSSSFGHRSSLASRRHSSSLHSHMRSHNGISNAHAFAVGKATGVNINGSAMGAHGVALHHSRQMRDRMIKNSIRRTTGGSRAIRKHATMGRSGFSNSTSSTNSRRRYTLNLNKNGLNRMGGMNQIQNYAGTGFLIFA